MGLFRRDRDGAAERAKAPAHWPRGDALVEDVTRTDSAHRRRGRDISVKVEVTYVVDPYDGGPRFTVSERRVYAAGAIPVQGGGAVLAWNPENREDFVVELDTRAHAAAEEQRRRWLAANGARARAVVTERQPTGRVAKPVSDSWDGDPAKFLTEVAVTFDVRPDAGAPFTVVRRQWDPVESVIQPGHDCLFVYDPRDPQGNSYAAFCSAQGRAAGRRDPVELAAQVFDGRYGARPT